MGDHLAAVLAAAGVAAQDHRKLILCLPDSAKRPGVVVVTEAARSALPLGMAVIQRHWQPRGMKLKGQSPGGSPRREARLIRACRAPRGSQIATVAVARMPAVLFRHMLTRHH